MKIMTLLKTKEKIILETINVIHECGIQDLSTREIAKRVGISEPAIFKHFRTKNDLILAVLDHFSLYDTDIIQSIRAKDVTPVEAIRCFLDTYTSYFENYPQITALTQNFDILQNESIYNEKVTQILNTHTAFIKDMVEEAKISGQIRTEIDSQLLSVTIIGLLREWCLHWRISKCSFSLKERVLETLDMLLKVLR